MNLSLKSNQISFTLNRPGIYLSQYPIIYCFDLDAVPQRGRFMSKNQSSKTNLSRRRFLQLVAASSAATIGGLSKSDYATATTGPKRTIPLPKFKVEQVDKTAAEIYQCTPDMIRFWPARKWLSRSVSEELQGSSAKAMAANMIGNIKDGTIGHGWPVENPHEARMYHALNVAMTTWNENIGPYGENRENKGYLSWLPHDLPEKLTSTPMPVDEVDDLTKKIKVIASYAGADKVGITKNRPALDF